MKQYTDKELFALNSIIRSIKLENLRQIKKWGIQTHSLMEWLAYATEELGELSKAISEFEYREGNRREIHDEAIQTATLCLKIAEMIMEKK